MAPNACTDEHEVISWVDKRRACVDDMQRGAHEADGLHPNVNRDVDHEDDTSVVHGMRRTVNELESKMQGEQGKMKEPRLDEKLSIVGLNAEEKPMTNVVSSEIRAFHINVSESNALGRTSHAQHRFITVSKIYSVRKQAKIMMSKISVVSTYMKILCSTNKLKFHLLMKPFNPHLQKIGSRAKLLRNYEKLVQRMKNL